MSLEAIVNLIVNSSVSIVVIAYFMFRDYKFVQQLNTNIQKLIDVMTLSNEKVTKLMEEGGKEK